MRILLSLLIVLVCGLVACTTPGEGELKNEPLTIRGSVSYAEKVALTADSVLVVELNEVNSHGEIKGIVSKTRIVNPGQVPIPFEINIPAGEVRNVKHYGVNARVEHDGRVLFDQQEPYPVLTYGFSTVANVQLRMVNAQ